MTDDGPLILPGERGRILAGDYSPLVRKDEPKFDKGAELILSMARPRAHWDDVTKHVVQPDPWPTFWIVVTAVVRKAKGGWSVHFDVHDARTDRRLIRRRPPVYGAAAMTHDREAPVDVEAARKASHYTTDPRQAVDDLEAVDDATLDQYAADARINRAIGDADAVDERLSVIARLPLRDRARALERLATERGVDTRADLKALERRLLRRLRHGKT